MDLHQLFKLSTLIIYKSAKNNGDYFSNQTVRQRI